MEILLPPCRTLTSKIFLCSRGKDNPYMCCENNGKMWQEQEPVLASKKMLQCCGCRLWRMPLSCISKLCCLGTMGKRSFCSACGFCAPCMGHQWFNAFKTIDTSQNEETNSMFKKCNNLICFQKEGIIWMIRKHGKWCQHRVAAHVTKHITCHLKIWKHMKKSSSKLNHKDCLCHQNHFECVCQWQFHIRKSNHQASN